jgi:hypothetical protein
MFSRIGKGIVDFDTFGMVPGCSTHVHLHIHTCINVELGSKRACAKHGEGEERRTGRHATGTETER